MSRVGLRKKAPISGKCRRCSMTRTGDFSGDGRLGIKFGHCASEAGYRQFPGMSLDDELEPKYSVVTRYRIGNSHCD